MQISGKGTQPDQQKQTVEETHPVSVKKDSAVTGETSPVQTVSKHPEGEGANQPIEKASLQAEVPPDQPSTQSDKFVPNRKWKLL